MLCVVEREEEGQGEAAEEEEGGRPVHADQQVSSSLIQGSFVTRGNLLLQPTRCKQQSCTVYMVASCLVVCLLHYTQELLNIEQPSLQHVVRQEY